MEKTKYYGIVKGEKVDNNLYLIKDVLDDGDDSSVYSETTFSEAYGAVIVLPGGYKDREEYVKKTLFYL